ncbi:hypothetical protein CYMTET_48179 [Cymbomonas tetramitiformis]|uniref:Uncharacterized protein n=1 Tax=Cymbomonas tetramitiformis TaxID=36881 RepID=A0AAE0BSV8_9CHLO|nr:hypothetical protein CYMTET_48179 [Cymbomonas tetramitiformis]
MGSNETNEVEYATAKEMLTGVIKPSLKQNPTRTLEEVAESPNSKSHRNMSISAHVKVTFKPVLLENERRPSRVKRFKAGINHAISALFVNQFERHITINIPKSCAQLCRRKFLKITAPFVGVACVLYLQIRRKLKVHRGYYRPRACQCLTNHTTTESMMQ